MCWYLYLLITRTQADFVCSTRNNVEHARAEVLRATSLKEQALSMTTGLHTKIDLLIKDLKTIRANISVRFFVILDLSL